MTSVTGRRHASGTPLLIAAIAAGAAVVAAALVGLLGWMGAVGAAVVGLVLTVGLLVRDIDRAVNRALVWVVLFGIVLAVSSAVSGVVGAVAHHNVGESAAVYAAVVALALTPARERLQRGVDRLLYGARNDPYLAFVRLADRLEKVRDPADLLPAAASTVGAALRARGCVVEARDGEAVIRASVGSREGPAETLPLLHLGHRIGTLEVTLRPGSRRLSASERRLLQTLAPQLAVAAWAALLADRVDRARQALVIAREDERARIRHDLHDGVGPRLAGLSLGLQSAGNRVSTDAAAAAALLGQLTTAVDSCIAEIRRVIDDLRPVEVDQLGLVGALQRFVDDTMTQQSSVTVTIDADPDLGPLPSTVEVAAYRVAVEAVTNVLRHAGASRCRVSLRRPTEGLVLEVCDDGHGARSLEGGVGVTSMRRRVTDLGGEIDLDTGPAGTKVLATFPGAA